MSNMALFIALGLTGQQRVVSGLNDVSRQGSDAAKRMGAAWRSAGSNLSTLGMQMAGLVGGWSTVRSLVTGVAEFDRALTDMSTIRARMLDISRTTLQLPEDQIAAFQQMVAAGVDPKQAIKGMAAINRAATASFADVRDIASSTIDLLQKMDIKPENLERSFNMMITRCRCISFATAMVLIIIMLIVWWRLIRFVNRILLMVHCRSIWCHHERHHQPGYWQPLD
jgi:hypothetical protein